MRLPLLFLIFAVISSPCERMVAGEPSYDLVAALKGLATSGEKNLFIPPGRYPLPAGGVLLKKLKDVTIQAKDVFWIATDLDSSALIMEDCENVTIEGLTIDYDPLPFTQGNITAVDPATRAVELEVHKGYPDFSDKILEHKQVHLFSKDTARWEPGAPDYYPKKIERLSPRTARILFSKDAEGFERFAVGKRIVMTIRKKSGVSIRTGCRGLRFSGVTLHAAPGIGFLMRFSDDAGTFQNVKVVPGPRPVGADEDRLVSTSADALNAAYTRKGPLIEDCEFSYMGDDGINLHGVMLPVLEWLDERTLLTMRPNRGEPFDKLIQAGDEVRFLTGPSYEIAAMGKVASVTLRKEKPDDLAAKMKTLFPTSEGGASAVGYEIRLQEAVTGVPTGTFAEVPALHASSYIIRRNYFHDHRARGLRLMASNGVVENNRFERLKGAAITIGGEFAFWREAGWVRDVEIRGNRITDVCEGANVLRKDNYTTGAISIFARVEPQGDATKYFRGHEDIRITNNEINGCALNGIAVTAAREVTITGNQIRQVNRIDSPESGESYALSGQQPILIIQAEAELKDNVIEEKQK